MFDVFISYSSKNDEYAHMICRQLESEGIKCWYAPRDIVAGESWASAIVNAIKTAKIFVLVFSEQSNGSKQVLREVNLAADKNRYIIPFRIDNTDMEGDMEYYLQSLQWMDAHSRAAEEAIGEMAKRIKHILGRDETDSSVDTFDSKETEIPVVSLDDEVDAGDVVEEEMDNCELLGVNADFEVAKPDDESQGNIMDNTDDEDEDDEDDDKANDRYQRFLNWCFLLAGILSVVFLLWEYAYPSVQKWMDRDNMHFEKISEYTHYRYPFYSTSMFTADKNMLFMEDTETNKLVLAKTDSGYPVVTGIDYKYKNPYLEQCYATEDSDIVYFFESSKKIIKIYDRVKNKWINSKGISLNLAVTEQVGEILYNRSSLGLSKEITEDIIIFVFDYKGENNCFSKIINMKSDGTYDVMDITEHKLVSFIGLAKGKALMWTDDERIKILNFIDGTVPDLTHEEIVKKYVPSLDSGNDVLSPDKRYFCRQKRTGDALNVVVWELESGKRVFNSSFAKRSSAYFSANSKLLLYNYENIKLVEYTFGKKEKQRVVFDKDYFVKNREFIEYPHSFYYSVELDKCFFSSVMKTKKGKYKDKLVMTDLKGNIVGQSDEFEIPGESSYPDIWVNNDKIFYIYNIAGSDKTFDDGTYSMIYRSIYSIDDDGKIKFEQ